MFMIKLLVFIFCISPLICIPAGIWGIRDGDILFGIAELLAGVVVLVLEVWAFFFGDKWEKKKADEQAEIERAEAEKKRIEEAKEQERIAQINLLMKEGKWTFPAEKFYQLCDNGHATDLNNEFGFRKARLIAEQLIKEYSADIDLENCGEYLKKESLEDYLKKGMSLADESAARARKAEERKIQAQKQPRSVVPTPQESECIKKASALIKLYGCDKRISILTDSLNDYIAKVQSMSENIDRAIGLVDVPKSLQKKEQDWAITGGIADGLAGPAAGVIAAANTVAKNQKIREHNAQMQNLSVQLRAEVSRMMAHCSELERERDKISKALDEARRKVVLSKPDATEIWKNINIVKTTVKKSSSGVLSATAPISLRNTLNLDVPDNVQMVVDGVLKAEVWFEDKYVDAMYFPLPLYGVSCNTSEIYTLEGMCGRSVEYNGEYTLKFGDEQNLWVMEA